MVSEKLIQILAYRQGLDKNTSKPFIWQKHFSDITVKSVTELFEHLDTIIKLIPLGDRVNVHYTNANCNAPTEDKVTPLRDFAYQEMIPIDLDDGIDLTKEAEYSKIIADVCEIDLKKTGIFCSGNGLHYVIALTQRIESVEELNKLQKYYTVLAGKITVALFESGLPGKCDPVRLAESATLRLPNTINRKEGKPDTQAYVINKHIEPQPFYLDRLVDLVEEREIEKTTFRVDAKAVLKGCCFLNYCLSNPLLVTEPQWYNMLGVLAFVPETGMNLCHTYSEKHPEYDFENTQRKAEQAFALGKPRLCQSVSQVYSGCAQCPYNGKVKTPLSIKGEDFIKTEFDGFHDVIKLKSGDKFIPNYGDLTKFFLRKHLFVVNQSTRLVSTFNGTHWTAIENSIITAFAQTHFFPDAKNNMRAEFLGRIQNTNIVSADFYDKDNKGFVNFKNGVLRIVDKVLLPHSPDFGFTYVLPYDYNPYAKCPEFQRLLDNVTLKDKGLQDILLEFVGYAISGARASFGAKALILTGGGSNGKSTFLDVVKMLVGHGSFSAVGLEEMADSNSRFAMVGKLFNICEEIEEKELRKGTAIFKTIVTGGEMMVWKKFSDKVTMRLDAKLIISCNELPSSRDNTYAIYRRMLIVPFRAKFTKDTTGIDKGILGRVEQEMSGVYNMVLEAYDRFLRNNGIFSGSDVAEKALEEYRYNNSTFNQFADACLEAGTAEDFITNDELMTLYNSWAQMNNVSYKPDSTKLAKELKTIGMITTDSVIRKIGSVSKRGYLGIRKLNNGAF